MILGDFEILPIMDGYFRLDAGSIFGIIPRVIWEKKIVPDERHRIKLAVRTLLVRNGKRTILIDTGQGNKFSEKFRERYSVEQPTTLIDNLQVHGVKPEDITDVINCHLHFDHAGWNTIREGGNPEGRLIPTFPNARYWSQKGEWERAHAYQTQRDQASFEPNDFLPLEQPRWELPEGDKNVIPGIDLLPVPGHSRFTQGVLIRAGDQKVAFLGDLIPTTNHVPYAWIMAFDLHPTETLETKRKLLPRAVREKWLCVFDHDPNIAVGRITEEAHGVLGVIPAEEFSE